MTFPGESNSRPARRAKQGSSLWHKSTARRRKVKMIMTFVNPTVAYGCQTWAIADKEKQLLDTWCMKTMRRARGATKQDKVRSAVILRELRALSCPNLSRNDSFAAAAMFRDTQTNDG